jgi:hypothetical protein
LNRWQAIRQDVLRTDEDSKSKRRGSRPIVTKVQYLHSEKAHLGYGLLVVFLLSGTPVNAQQINGTLGSPSATTTIDGKYLPNQPAPFGGVINLGANQSKPWWPPRVVPSKGAPDVLLIMTDDAGYGDLRGLSWPTIGSSPFLKAIAAIGTMYWRSLSLLREIKCPGGCNGPSVSINPHGPAPRNYGLGVKTAGDQE